LGCPVKPEWGGAHTASLVAAALGHLGADLANVRCHPTVTRELISRIATLSRQQNILAQAPNNNDEDRSLIRMTREARHWIEYGVFVFVIITAIATATAAWYTRKEWQSTTDNGRRQLRAYVFPDQANLVWQGTTKPTVAEIVIKNSGQTPAYRLSTTTSISVDNNPLQTDLRVPSMPDNHTVIPPSGSYALSVGMDKPLTADQLKTIQKGTQAIYVIGEIAYDDAFGECRVTRYRFFYTGAGADIGSKVGLAYLDEGNTEVPCTKTR
jgi:hypothetical protein